MGFTTRGQRMLTLHPVLDQAKVREEASNSRCPSYDRAQQVRRCPQVLPRQSPLQRLS